MKLQQLLLLPLLIIKFIKPKKVTEPNYNPSEIESDEAKFDGYTIYHRVIPETNLLSDNDYRIGFGLNNSHYFKVARKREKLGLPTRDLYKETYENISRDGLYDITGKKIVSKYHPLHDKMLLEKETGIKYHIDIVSIGYHYGKIMTLVTRADGSKSHGCKDWDILLGGDPDTIQRVKENRENYTLIDK